MNQTSLSNIHWLGHASFRIDSKDAVIYIDPWQLCGSSKSADLVLITHDHGDHCSPDDVKKIQREDTIIVTVKDSREKLVGDIRVVQPGDRISVQGIEISAVPAYNLTKFRSPGVPYHPKEKGYVGFIIKLKDQTIYHAGDTDVIPEMAEIRTNVALLPVSGTYVMTPDEALDAVDLIKPDVAVPMHVGRGIGCDDDLRQFMEMSSVPVKVLEF